MTPGGRGKGERGRAGLVIRDKARGNRDIEGLAINTSSVLLIPVAWTVCNYRDQIPRSRCEMMSAIIARSGGKMNGTPPRMPIGYHHPRTPISQNTNKPLTSIAVSRKYERHRPASISMSGCDHVLVGARQSYDADTAAGSTH